MARCPNDEVEQALSQYLTSVSRRWHIEKAILFGSRARDDYMLDSDVDLILVSRDFAPVPLGTSRPSGTRTTMPPTAEPTLFQNIQVVANTGIRQRLDKQITPNVVRTCVVAAKRAAA